MVLLENEKTDTLLGFGEAESEPEIGRRGLKTKNEERLGPEMLWGWGKVLISKVDASENSLVGHWGNVEIHGAKMKDFGYYACKRQLAFTVACRLESREGVSTWLVLTGALL